MKKEKTKGKSFKPGASFTVGAIALVFLVTGYQIALFVHRAAVLKLASDRDSPDTVFVIDRNVADELLREREIPPEGEVRVRKSQERTRPSQKGRAESFPFDPNTVSMEDLVRLGFSQKQAQSIVNYRSKGGRFRRKEDFAKSYVVSDSIYERLAPYIDIPKLDINRADSAALTSLPGIGPWFAGKIVGYRSALRGFSSVDQLLEIYRFDKEKLDGMRDLITCSPPEPYPLWTLSEEELSAHPYISRAEAHGIVLYRTHHPAGECTLEGLEKAGVISWENAGKLRGIRILSPEP